MLAHAREDADIVIDTSLSTSRKLKEMIYKKFSTTDYAMNITVMSFGFKFGPQTDADMLFDVRCLPNPYYVEDMSSLTGLDQKVSEYVFQWDESQGYFRKIMDALTFALPLFSNEGRSNLTIAFGCTGGHHRSVSFAQRAAEEIQKAGYRVSVIHRDIEKS